MSRKSDKTDKESSSKATTWKTKTDRKMIMYYKEIVFICTTYNFSFGDDLHQMLKISNVSADSF
jgi:hypothetical protein